MSDKFENLPEEKRKRIIDACIEEFALKGYGKASTNAIIKKAGISKGILFHYFGNKRRLFLYVIDYVMDYLTENYFADKAGQPEDFFERMIWFSLLKMKAVRKEPLMIRMVFRSFVDVPEELKKDLMDRYDQYYTQFVPPLLEGIDTSKFRKDINPQKAMEFIMVCIEGLQDRYMRIYKNYPTEEVFSHMDETMEEYREYLDILKYGLYGNK